MSSSSNHWPIEAPAYESLAAAVQGEAARWNVPGMTAAVLYDGERTATATGVTNLEHPAPVTVDTRFQIGSISKVFTGTAIMALVDQGKIDLDTPVTAWIPELPLTHGKALESLTLRNLLNHTTGFEGDVFFDTGAGDDALASCVARFEGIRHWTVPGELFAYCNTGFYLAGRIIEIVTGKTYEDAITELVIDPAGLSQTSFASADLATVPTAAGHMLKDRASGYRVYRPWALPRVVNAAGGVVSTVDDLLTFAEMHMDDGMHGDTRVLSASAATSMRERTSTFGVVGDGYGTTWHIQNTSGTTLVGHGGATNGFRATLVTVPDRGFALAMLTNGDPGSSAMQAVQRWALQHWLDLDSPIRQVIDADDATLDAVTGHYERHDATFDVWRVDDHLRIERRTVAHEDQFSSERDDDDPPTVMDAWPTGDGVFRVTEGPLKNALIDFFDGRLFGDDGELATRPLLRFSWRIAERTGDAPAPATAAAD